MAALKKKDKIKWIKVKIIMFVSCSQSFNSGNILKEIENIIICLSIFVYQYAI